MNNVKFFFIILAGLAMFLEGALAESTPSVCKATPADVTTKSVDLRDEMPPLRDQGSIGWCYGFTAADLLGHYLYKTNGKTLLKKDRAADFHSRKYSVSGIGVSTAYNMSLGSSYNKDLSGKLLSELKKINKKVFPEGGTIAEAISAAKANGICFEKDLSSEDFGHVSDYRCVINYSCDAADILDIVYDTPREVASCRDLMSIQKMFSSLDLKTIQKILMSSARENAINNLVNASCKNRFSESKFDLHRGPVVETYNLDKSNSGDALVQALDMALDQGRPVGILYYSAFLKQEGLPKTHNHASSIVGKRYNPKTCEVEYILRNSWGPGCGFYTKDNPGFDKCLDTLKPLFKLPDHDKKAQQAYFDGVIACRKNYPPLPRNPRVLCDELSHAIVRKSDLAKQIYNITMIKENDL